MFRETSFLKLVLAGVFLFAFAPFASAGNVSGCAADFSSCSLYEDGLVLTLPGLAISGDVILLDVDRSVSDVFRIFNDFVDTGGGTGLGGTAELFSLSLRDLPLPTTYSANAVTIAESTTVIVGGANAGLTETDYNGNGTIYRLFSSEEPVTTPEPTTFGMLGMGFVVLGSRYVKRANR
jgi:hypothetical protein